MRLQSAWAIVVVRAAVLLTACHAEESDESPAAGTPAASSVRFANAQDVVAEINRLSSAGAIRCGDLAPLVYAETSFQRAWVEFLELVARAEDLHDAVDNRFGEPIDARRGDVRINVSWRDALLVTEDDQRAEAAVESVDESLKRIMLVKIGSEWWISGYTWEHSMSAEKKGELPRRSLTYQVEAQIGPPLAARVRAGDFSTLDDLRSAHRDALMTYFEGHPDIYQQITGKPFRRP